MKEKLKEEQLKLAKEVITKDEFKKIELVAGVDQSFIENKVISGIVVIKDKKVIERKYAVKESIIPYMPGYLFYREGPAILEAYNLLENKPDLIFIDGNGILHPRRIGLASHVGLLLDKPVIGIAKKLLIGKEKRNEVEVDNEVRAIKIASKEFAKPIYVSPGHKISLRTAFKITKEFLDGTHKLPAPLKLAHKYVNKIKERLKKEENSDAKK